MTLPEHYTSKVEQLKEIYSEIDDAIVKFRSTNTLSCLPGCGQCCENPMVFVTVLEVIPLAIQLFEKGDDAVILERIAGDRKQPCVFYRPDPLVKGNGRCSVYPLRPAICRLFGFSAQEDKHGTPRLITCQKIKAKDAGEVRRVDESLRSGKSQAPLIHGYTARLLAIDPTLSQQQYPINIALELAIEKLGWFFKENTA